MKHSFIICDSNAEFAERMASYVNKRHLAPYIMESFTDVNLLTEYARRSKIEVLLIDECLYTEELVQLEPAKVFLLSDDQNNMHLNDMEHLYKYSSIPEIMKIVMCDYAERNKNAMSIGGNTKTKLLGAFSPFPGLECSSFLLTMALKIAEKKSVFYLSIKSTHGFRKILNKMSEPDLSDIMYEIKNGKKQMSEWTTGAIITYGNLDYVLPPPSITDLQCTENTDWNELMEALINSGKYEYILLDIDESISECFNLLDRCQLIYSPYDDNSMCRAAYAEMEDTLYKIGCGSVFEKMKKVEISGYRPEETGEDYFASLKDGKMSIYVERIISGYN